MKRKIRNYYQVSIEKDATPDVQFAGELAIEEAKERARMFIIPALWTAKRIGQTPNYHVFRVCRIHNSGHPIN